jgi:hypothetical protein
MEAFRIDFPVVTELTNALRTPFSIMSEIEVSTFDLVDLYHEFEALAFDGIDRGAIGMRPSPETRFSEDLSLSPSI